MSELPNFKEGLIFDIKDGLNENSPIVLTADTPCLFKLHSVMNYNKHYKHWRVRIFNNETNTQLMGNNYYLTYEILNYSDLSFYKRSTIYFANPIVWLDDIYVFINSDFYTGEISLSNNVVYKVVFDRYLDDKTTVSDTTIFYFKTNFTNPTVSYNNENILFGNNGYEITINNPVTTLDWTYNKNNSSDELKYYQFLLYNSQGKCVVDTGKIYTDTTEGNGFVCNSLDDKSIYTLVGYCVSQNGIRLDLPDLCIKTEYTTGRIYTNLTIELNKHCAENTVCAEVINLVGKITNGNAVFINNEKIDLKTNDSAVTFTDTYNLPTDNFVIRLWINGIKNEKKVTILKLTNPYDSDYIEVYYENGYFYAIKYSYGLISRYISNAVDNNDVLNGNIYLSMLYCNGRIDIYATSYIESEVIAQ